MGDGVALNFSLPSKTIRGERLLQPPAIEILRGETKARRLTQSEIVPRRRNHPRRTRREISIRRSHANRHADPAHRKSLHLRFRRRLRRSHACLAQTRLRRFQRRQNPHLSRPRTHRPTAIPAHRVRNRPDAGNPSRKPPRAIPSPSPNTTSIAANSIPNPTIPKSPAPTSSTNTSPRRSRCSTAPTTLTTPISNSTSAKPTSTSSAASQPPVTTNSPRIQRLRPAHPQARRHLPALDAPRCSRRRSRKSRNHAALARDRPLLVHQLRARPRRISRLPQRDPRRKRLPRHTRLVALPRVS